MTDRYKKFAAVDALIEAASKLTSFYKSVPFIRIDASPDTIRASAIPNIERGKLSGFQFTIRGDFTYRITRRSSRIGAAVPGYQFDDVDDPFRGYICEDFKEVKRIVALIEAADDPVAAFDNYRKRSRT